MSAKTIRYCPHIDGLRAIAVLSVMFYHADLGLGGGFTGVDVFFVISGYLITGLILKGMEGGTFSLAEFWERRVRRIIPPLAVVVLASLIVGWFILMPAPLTLLARSAFVQALMCSNFHFWMESGYFDTASTTKPLLHTWSLAVEEQFY
ncbi:MAG TPA: acyltransferase, partial [Roseimicrobium sp.]|nr:acyltransferase [Roseimicrobium sp.]